MTPAVALDWMRHLLWTSMLVGGPVVVTGLVIGAIVAVLSAATQINDSSVSFTPKAIASGVALVVAGPFMLTQLVEFARAALTAMGHVHP